jgi:hypothetical protein
MPCGLSNAFASTIIVPELEIWANRFIVSSYVNKHEVPYPPETPEVCFPPGSFITMLFDESYRLDYYKYLYKLKEDRLAWPYVVKQRLLIYPRSGQYQVLDDAGANLFMLQADDFTMLDALLAYRMDSTSLVMIDSTSTEVITDSTSGITTIYADFNFLTTELSKLIYLYLDLEVNKTVRYYNSTVPISTTKALETIYELFVLDKIFAFLATEYVDPAFRCQ